MLQSFNPLNPEAAEILVFKGGLVDPSFSSPQCVSSGAEGSVCVLEAAVRRPRPPAGHQQASDQRLALPAIPLPRHHVAIALQSDARISRRPDVPNAHAHRQSHPEPRQLRQVSICGRAAAALTLTGFLLFLKLDVSPLQVWKQRGIYGLHE